MRIDDRPLLDEAVVVLPDPPGAASLRLLGGFELRVGARPVTLSLGPQRLLAYLAVRPGAHPREALAARFWPDTDEPGGRASLRSAVWTLRRAVIRTR